MLEASCEIAHYYMRISNPRTGGNFSKRFPSVGGTPGADEHPPARSFDRPTESGLGRTHTGRGATRALRGTIDVRVEGPRWNIKRQLALAEPCCA